MTEKEFIAKSLEKTTNELKSSIDGSLKIASARFESIYCANQLALGFEGNLPNVLSQIIDEFEERYREEIAGITDSLVDLVSETIRKSILPN